MAARTRATLAGTSFMVPAHPCRPGAAAADDQGLGRRDVRRGRALARLSQHRADDVRRRRRVLRPARRSMYADNVRNYYRLCRDRDLFLTHAIVNPQTDRSKGSHQQEGDFAHLGVVEETKDGLIVRGAKMLATHGPTADELLVYPQPGIRDGEERYVLAFGIPVRHAGSALHLPRAVRSRHPVAVGSSARRALRGARCGLRVRRRAHSLGPRLPLRRRQDGQCAVRAGEPAQSHRPSDGDPRPRQDAVRHRRRGRA